MALIRKKTDLIINRTLKKSKYIYTRLCFSVGFFIEIQKYMLIVFPAQIFEAN